MIQFVSAFAILAATAAATSMHYSNVVQHSYPKRARQIAPDEYYPIYVLENYDEHFLDRLPKYLQLNNNHESVYFVDRNERNGDHNSYHGDDGYFGRQRIVYTHDDFNTNQYHPLPNHLPDQLGNSAHHGHENHGLYEETHHGGHSNVYNDKYDHGLYDDAHHRGYANAYKDYSNHPKYNFEYGVNDFHTGDHKQQWETRNGDVVKGGYTMKEADGTIRIVEYTADDEHGFNAVVKNIGHAHHTGGHKLEARTNEQSGGYGDLKNYAGAYASGDYYKNGATSYSKIWKKN
ncbi:uncharacterized protein LOC129766762 [Toxorhynchites rutilus septentrionalis]|uniref:uncharacterized protein LOC129766762 n=1 Tax=Toxorhynchites rutilus septentrionalis TaxID=329112 RepID=UPI0024796545|nr:uncharacterized protein LOC129766762 [Toxorhynchites rutilus septentrionalis]